MKRILALAPFAWLLLVTACASPGSGQVRVSEAALAAATEASSPATKLLPTQPPEPDWPNLPYVPEGSPQQMLDVYLPPVGEGPFPTILAIHGGGFRSRSKALYRQMAGHFTRLGYAFASTNYRLAPLATYPAQVEDVFCALAWVRANHATYGFDPGKVIVMGDSAGGYLAALLGTVDTPDAYLENCPHRLQASDSVQAVIVFYGFYDFTRIEDFPGKGQDLEPYWGFEYGQIPPATLAEMSPMSWVDGSEPPFLLIHGESDPLVPSWMSEDFAASLEAAGVTAELVLVDAGHAFILQRLSSPANVQSLEAIHGFLEALESK